MKSWRTLLSPLGVALQYVGEVSGEPAAPNVIRDVHLRTGSGERGPLVTDVCDSCERQRCFKSVVRFRLTDRASTVQHGSLLSLILKSEGL